MPSPIARIRPAVAAALLVAVAILLVVAGTARPRHAQAGTPPVAVPGTSAEQADTTSEPQSPVWTQGLPPNGPEAIHETGRGGRPVDRGAEPKALTQRSPGIARPEAVQKRLRALATPIPSEFRSVHVLFCSWQV